MLYYIYLLFDGFVVGWEKLRVYMRNVGILFWVVIELIVNGNVNRVGVVMFEEVFENL